MALTDKVKKFAKGIALGIGIAGIFAGTVTGISYLTNTLICNEKRFYEDYVFLSKTDGPFNQTALAFYRGGKILVMRSHLLGGKKNYLDKDGDGKVDELELSNMELFRDKHFEKYKEKFQEADKDLKEQLERFKPDIDEWKEFYE